MNTAAKGKPNEPEQPRTILFYSLIVVAILLVVFAILLIWYFAKKKKSAGVDSGVPGNPSVVRYARTGESSQVDLRKAALSSSFDDIPLYGHDYHRALQVM